MALPTDYSRSGFGNRLPVSIRLPADLTASKETYNSMIIWSYSPKNMMIIWSYSPNNSMIFWSFGNDFVFLSKKNHEDST
jgi:hypothetical protein